MKLEHPGSKRMPINLMMRHTHAIEKYISIAPSQAKNAVIVGKKFAQKKTSCMSSNRVDDSVMVTKTISKKKMLCSKCGFSGSDVYSHILACCLGRKYYRCSCFGCVFETNSKGIQSNNQKLLMISRPTKSPPPRKHFFL